MTEEQLFQSAYHFSGRIARHVAARLCDRLGFDAKYGRRIDEFLFDAPFVPRFVPVHPSIAKYFGMRWVKQDTLYPFLWEGGVTFDEYVLRFMRAQWSETLQEGVIDAWRGEARAREKLVAGLVEAPRSAVGRYELSCILQREGDPQQALALQEEAVALEPTERHLRRLGSLLRNRGDFEAARAAFARAALADGASPVAWACLRDCLVAMGRLEEALQAAERAIEFAVEPGPAQIEAERIRLRLARAP